jgi:hypothetical protein
MTDTTTTETAAPTEEATVYPYEPIAEGAALYVYTGTPVLENAVPTTAAGYSKWSPVPAPPGQVAYFDGTGWVLRSDLRSYTPAQLQALAQLAQTKTFNATVEAAAGTYSSYEKSSWSQQVSDAQAVLQDKPTSGLIDKLAAARGITTTQLAEKIISKAGAYSTAYNIALATLQQQRSQTESGATLQAVAALIKRPQDIN